MTVVESGGYQAARDRIKGNPIISQMAAGVATVPLADLAHQDGTPRFTFLQHANRVFDQAEQSRAAESCPSCSAPFGPMWLWVRRPGAISWPWLRILGGYRDACLSGRQNLSGAAVVLRQGPGRAARCGFTWMPFTWPLSRSR